MTDDERPATGAEPLPRDATTEPLPPRDVLSRRLTRRRRLQLFGAAAVVALTATVLGQHELAVGVIVAGLLVLPTDWFPPA